MKPKTFRSEIWRTFFTKVRSCSGSKNFFSLSTFFFRWRQHACDFDYLQSLWPLKTLVLRTINFMITTVKHHRRQARLKPCSSLIGMIFGDKPTETFHSKFGSFQSSLTPAFVPGSTMIQLWNWHWHFFTRPNLKQFLMFSMYLVTQHPGLTETLTDQIWRVMLAHHKQRTFLCLCLCLISTSYSIRFTSQLHRDQFSTISCSPITVRVKWESTSRKYNENNKNHTGMQHKFNFVLWF